MPGTCIIGACFCGGGARWPDIYIPVQQQARSRRVAVCGGCVQSSTVHLRGSPLSGTTRAEHFVQAFLAFACLVRFARALCAFACLVQNLGRLPTGRGEGHVRVRLVLLGSKVERLGLVCRGTSLMRNFFLPGPYSMPMPRALW